MNVRGWGGPVHGLFDVAGQPKPALIAYRSLTKELGQARYCGPWQALQGVLGHVFDREGQPVLVLWTPAPEGQMRVGISGCSSQRLVCRGDARLAADPAGRAFGLAADLRR
jgi:hypothetical protein